MRLTYYGHAAFSVETKGKNLLFDPFISPNPLAAHIKVADLRPDYILLSHAHGDHVADVETIARQSGATVVSIFEIADYYAQKGIQSTHPMNFGGAWDFDFGKVKMVQAAHSSVFPDGTYGGNPGGFIISNEEGAFYYAGDTALMMDMKIWGGQYDFRFVVLPIGDNFTMGVEDAVTAARFLQAKRVVGVHYNTFPYIEIDTEAAQRAFQAAGIDLLLPVIGETIEL